MSAAPIQWKQIKSLQEFDQILDQSRTKPILILKHMESSPESVKMKQRLEAEWDIPTDKLITYLVDPQKERDISDEITELSGVSDHCPQVFLLADSVTMYDESGEMIKVKKIKIALKIINRTFSWMETRA